MNKAEIAVSAVLALIGLALVIVVIPSQTSPAEDVTLGPAAFPTGCAALIAMLSAIRLFGLIKAGCASDGARREAVQWKTAAAVGLLIAVSIGIFKLISPLAAALLFLPTCMALMGERRPLVLIATPAVLVSAVYVLFYQVLGTPFQ
jgi:hypothetical protein